MEEGHINNLYNTTFWLLIQLGGLDNKEAERTLAVRSSFDSLWLLLSTLTIVGDTRRRQKRNLVLEV